MKQKRENKSLDIPQMPFDALKNAAPQAKQGPLDGTEQSARRQELFPEPVAPADAAPLPPGYKPLTDGSRLRDKMPLPPEVLVDARQDKIDTPEGRTRPALSTRSALGRNDPHGELWTAEEIEACKRAGWYLPEKSKSVPGGFYPSEAMRAFRDGLRYARSEKRISTMPLIKRFKEQRDRLADALRLFVKAEDEWRHEKGGIGEDKFDDPLSDAYKAAQAALADVPTYEQGGSIQPMENGHAEVLDKNKNCVGYLTKADYVRFRLDRMKQSK